jgi:hypothetical protein
MKLLFTFLFTFRETQAGVRLLAAVAVSLMLGPALQARTIVLTDEDCEQMAIIGSEAPRLSWVGYEGSPGEFTGIFVDLYPSRAFLIRYPLEKIPKGQRITSAEWVLPVTLISPASEQKLHIRRVIGEWGAGVCHQYRMIRPKKAEWAVPGAKGASKDRAAKPSAVVRIGSAVEQVVNVTEDVELWYSGAAANHGWIVTQEDGASLVRLSSPVWATRGNWKLRITYEPE